MSVRETAGRETFESRRTLMFRGTADVYSVNLNFVVEGEGNARTIDSSCGSGVIVGILLKRS